jgi:hypothetical protein
VIDVVSYRYRKAVILWLASRLSRNSVPHALDPILDQKPSCRLRAPTTASAAEIVSGAVQDLDVGTLLAVDLRQGDWCRMLKYCRSTRRSSLPWLHYTPFGRCIQRIDYKEGGGSKAEDGNFQAVEKVDGES